MNRRNFLKSIAAVAAGAVAVPVAAKKLPWTQYSMTYKFEPNPAQKEIARMCNTTTGERAWVQYKGTWDEIPYHQVGKRYYTGDGRVYLYL